MSIEALAGLADRFRPAGLFIVALACDGRVVYHDTRAAAFFRKYVLPCIQNRQTLAAHAGVQPEITITDAIPGVILASFPLIERRHVTQVILLAGRSETFAPDEEVLRTCGQLHIDAAWLAQQASILPAYGSDAIEAQARLLEAMAHDQIQLCGYESELNALSTQLSNTYEELSLIYQLSGGMRVNRSPREFFRQACHDVMDVVGVRGLGVAVNIDNCPLDQPLLYGTVGLTVPQIKKLGQELIEVLSERKSPLLINELSNRPTFGWLADLAHNLIAVPLQRQEEVFGCIFALEKTRGEFDTVDAKLLNSIANESAIYLENAILYEDVRGLLMGLLHSLVNAVDAKDAYTCGHSERVALLSRVIAMKAGHGDQFVERIHMAGLLHDVGKIGVPEQVLQKPGTLTDAEFEQIKKHPQIGAKILQDIRQLEDIVPGVLYHHERFDGKGYPSGLAGKDIPLIGRIICLADSFDAMTTSRTYRQAMPTDAALAEIRRCAGTQFDPELTQVLLSIGADRIHQLLVDHKHQTKTLIQLQQSLRAA